MRLGPWLSTMRRNLEISQESGPQMNVAVGIIASDRAFSATAWEHALLSETVQRSSWGAVVDPKSEDRLLPRTSSSVTYARGDELVQPPKI
jgi:hypothetical protein